MERERRGFTLVELLVVIAIIALLMGILMPALARVRQIAYRLHCGTNLSGIGKAMLIYSNDYSDDFPRAGSGGWGLVTNWLASNAASAYGTSGNATITSQFYLLIKYAEVTPASFLCKGDSGVTKFSLADHGSPADMDIVDCWDFGATMTQEHCSYAYHCPFAGYDLTSSSDPGMAVAGDPNPWLKNFETGPRSHSGPDNDWDSFLPIGDKKSISYGNSLTHQEDGQNILFVDGHVSMERASFCGIDDDNVYTSWAITGVSIDKKKGVRPSDAYAKPTKRNDSLLMTDNRPTPGP
ncbi:MAG: prepilin-type N-terminal cleavage/methylation domain-containing protein [Sedimentisphaerales bacterium]|nr:prepilin-type N-terminal cleavage/methylation domain-containing protein [Sedimentisphaerales bacterium]